MEDPTDAFNLISFRARHRELAERHERFLREKVYDVTDKLAQTILDCTKLAVSRPEAKSDKSFLHAFILLASKVMSHTESARLLLNVGRYGDVAVIIRALSSDVMMIQYLSLFPEEVRYWLQLAASRGGTGAPDRAYRRMLDRFSETRMREKIGRLGYTPVFSRGSFAAYSEAIHSSPWGLQFYSSQQLGPEGNFSVQFQPTYEPLVALREATVVGALVLQVTEDFLSWCEGESADWHWEVLEGWRPLQTEAIRTLQVCMNSAKLAHTEFFGPGAREGTSNPK